MKFSNIIFLFIILHNVAIAGFPPTTAKGSSDSTDITTFKFRFPNVSISHSGAVATFGTVGVASGGTGLTSPGTVGNVLTSNGSAWTSSPPSSGGGDVGDVKSTALSTCPTGWLAMDGSFVSRVTYAALFAAIGTTYSSGDGSTTFGIPDTRWTTVKGYGPNISVTGSGSASSNNGTFTSHGLNRTGVRVRLSSGTLSGLSSSTDYYAIVVDANTLAFATTYANAIAGTKITLSGTNSGVIIQWEDPDTSTRLRAGVGGNTTGVGTRQEDQFKSHQHNLRGDASTALGAGSGQYPPRITASYNSNHTTDVVGGNQTNVRDIYFLYCIKY